MQQCSTTSPPNLKNRQPKQMQHLPCTIMTLNYMLFICYFNLAFSFSRYRKNIAEEARVQVFGYTTHPGMFTMNRLVFNGQRVHRLQASRLNKCGNISPKPKARLLSAKALSQENLPQRAKIQLTLASCQRVWATGQLVISGPLQGFQRAQRT